MGVHIRVETMHLSCVCVEKNLSANTRFTYVNKDKRERDKNLIIFELEMKGQQEEGNSPIKRFFLWTRLFS